MPPMPTPAQFAVAPAGAVVAVGASLLLALGLAAWVGADARRWSDHPLAWALATVVAGLSPLAVGAVAVTALYRLSRPELGSIAPPTADRPVERGEVLGKPRGESRSEREKSAESAGADGSGDGEDAGVDGSGEEEGLGGFEPAEPIDDRERAR